jgi:hypothetical protein
LSRWRDSAFGNIRLADEKGGRRLRHLGQLWDALSQWQGWLVDLNQVANATAVSRHIGFLSGMYTTGVLVGSTTQP